MSIGLAAAGCILLGAGAALLWRRGKRPPAIALAALSLAALLYIGAALLFLQGV